MGRNFWSSFKKPFISVANDLNENTHDLANFTQDGLDIMKRHPVESGIVIGIAVLGGVATFVTGGAAAPEVAELEWGELGVIGFEESAAVIGADEAGVGAIELQEITADSLLADASGVQLEDEVTEAELQAWLDEYFGQGVFNLSNPRQVAAIIEENPTLVARLIKSGSRGIQVINTAGTIASVSFGVQSLINGAKEIASEQNTGKKITMLAALTAKAGALTLQATGKEIVEIGQLSKGLSFIGKTIGQLETEVKRSEAVLDNELQKVDKEEIKEVDSLARIATTLDRPTNIEDFLKDLQEFDTTAARIDYVAENYSTFILLEKRKMDMVLDILNDTINSNPETIDEIKKEERDFYVKIPDKRQIRTIKTDGTPEAGQTDPEQFRDPTGEEIRTGAEDPGIQLE